MHKCILGVDWVAHRSGTPAKKVLEMVRRRAAGEPEATDTESGPVGVIFYVDRLSGSHFTLSVHCTVDAKYCIPTGTRRMRYNSVRLNATGRTGTVAMMEPQFSSL